MTNDEKILAELKEIFIETLGHNNFELDGNTTANDVDGWDSVTHMMLINEVEKKYDMKFSLMDLMSLEKVADLVKAIEKGQA